MIWLFLMAKIGTKQKNQTRPKLKIYVSGGAGVKESRRGKNGITEMRVRIGGNKGAGETFGFGRRQRGFRRFFCGGQRKMQYAVWRRNVLQCMICWGKGNECCKPR